MGRCTLSIKGWGGWGQRGELVLVREWIIKQTALQPQAGEMVQPISTVTAHNLCKTLWWVSPCFAMKIVKNVNRIYMYISVQIQPLNLWFYQSVDMAIKWHHDEYFKQEKRTNKIVLQSEIWSSLRFWWFTLKLAFTFSAQWLLLGTELQHNLQHDAPVLGSFF